MTTALDTGMLRKAELSPFDINTIGVLVKTGGEAAWHPRAVKPLTLEGVNGMIAKGLVAIVQGPTGGQYLRLTDHGRAVAAQLEAMSAAPKIEVASP